MRLPRSCSLLLALLSCLCFPIIVQAGDFWTQAESKLELTEQSHSCFGPCHYLKSIAQVDAGQRSQPAREPGLKVLVRDAQATPNWNFEYQPQRAFRVKRLKPEIRPALLRQIKTQVQRTICTHGATIPGGFERQLAFGIVKALRPIERINIQSEIWQSEIASHLETLNAIDLASLGQKKAKPIALPASWQKKDNYWNFYSDCDRWEVCLRELELVRSVPSEPLTAFHFEERFSEVVEAVTSMIPRSLADRFASFSGSFHESSQPADHF